MKKRGYRVGYVHGDGAIEGPYRVLDLVKVPFGCACNDGEHWRAEHGS